LSIILELAFFCVYYSRAGLFSSVIPEMVFFVYYSRAGLFLLIIPEMAFFVYYSKAADLLILMCKADPHAHQNVTDPEHWKKLSPDPTHK
jgi:hypothetical protein